MLSYVGSPPYCKPECVVHSDCPSDRACEAEKCRNPCEGSCGIYAQCFVNNHVPVCLCPDGFTGDPFRQCTPKPVADEEPYVSDPCNPSPCGPNSVCNNGACSCITGYHGDPYLGCRPECVYNTDCPLDKGCSKNKCINPCVGTCGQNAICEVMNHVPMCSCPKGMSGNAFVECRSSAGKDSCFFIWYSRYIKFISNSLYCIFYFSVYNQSMQSVAMWTK